MLEGGALDGDVFDSGRSNTAVVSFSFASFTLPYHTTSSCQREACLLEGVSFKMGMFHY